MTDTATHLECGCTGTARFGKGEIVWCPRHGWKDEWPAMNAYCEVKGTDNHSDDRLEIFTGRHTVNEDGTVTVLPQHLCGFHAQKKGLI